MDPLPLTHYVKTCYSLVRDIPLWRRLQSRHESSQFNMTTELISSHCGRTCLTHRHFKTSWEKGSTVSNVTCLWERTPLRCYFLAAYLCVANECGPSKRWCNSYLKQKPIQVPPGKDLFPVVCWMRKWRPHMSHFERTSFSLNWALWSEIVCFIQ